MEGKALLAHQEPGEAEKSSCLVPFRDSCCPEGFGWAPGFEITPVPLGVLFACLFACLFVFSWLFGVGSFLLSYFCLNKSCYEGLQV